MEDHVISIAALVVSVGSLAFSLYVSAISKRISIANLDNSRYALGTGMLPTNPQLLKMHGISDKDLVNDGVSAEAVIYLMMVMTQLNIKRKAHSVDVAVALEDDEYRYQMFSQEETRKTWKYSKLLFRSDFSDGVDRYLSNHW